MGLWPDHTLLGLYHGVPLPERGHSYGNVLPDRITIFQQPIEALCRTPEEIIIQLKRLEAVPWTAYCLKHQELLEAASRPVTPSL